MGSERTYSMLIKNEEISRFRISDIIISGLQLLSLRQISRKRCSQKASNPYW